MNNMSNRNCPSESPLYKEYILIKNFVTKKSPNKLDIKGMCLTTTKTIYDKHTANIILKEEKLKLVPRSRIRQWYSLYHCYSTSCWEVLARASSFVDDMILYVEKPSLHPKTFWTDELIQQIFRMQYQHTKMRSCFIHQ
jgi:hypothetical protein